MSNNELSIRFEISIDMDSSDDDDNNVYYPMLLLQQQRLGSATVEQLVAAGITGKQALALVTRKRVLTSWSAVYTTLKSHKAVTLLQNAGFNF